MATRGTQGGMFPLMWATKGHLRIDIAVEIGGLLLPSPLATRDMAPHCDYPGHVARAQGEHSGWLAPRGNALPGLSNQKGPLRTGE